MINRLSLATLRLIARLVPKLQRAAWLREWDAELNNRRVRLEARNALTRQQELDMFRRVLGSFHDAAWLRRQFTRDADIVHDMRYGARLLRRNPGFAVLTVTVLALGMGATTGIYSVMDALLVRQLPYRDADRIVLLFEAPAANPAGIEGVAPANFIDWKAQATLVEFLAAIEPFGFTYTGDGEPQSMPGMRVSSDFFESLGMEALYGRTFTPEEYTAGRNRVAVLSHGTWTERFGADRGIVGRSIVLNGQPHSIVGVMPPSFAPRLLVTFSERGVWTPKVWSEFEQRLRGARHYNAVGKLKPGVTIQQAQAELDGIAQRLAQQHPRTNSDYVIQLVPLRDHLAGDLRPSIGLLLGAVGLLLLITMANTANLLMARASARVREILVRNAVGAGASRLVRQLLAETLTLAVFGCLIGFLVAYGTARVIVSLAPAGIPGLASVGVNGRVLLFSAALTCVVAILVGVVPAWRVSGLRFSASLTSQASDNTRVTARQRGRAVFVIAQVALALTLLAGSGLLLRSFSRLLETDPGFSPEGVAAVQVFVFVGPTSGTPPAQRAALFREAIDGMRRVPGVQDVGAASVIPFLNTTGIGSSAVTIEGRPAPAGGDEPSALFIIATPGYFSSMRIPLLDGRMLTDHDDGDSARVVLVSRAFAERHWPGSSPVGQRLRFTSSGTATVVEIVGVVDDVRLDSLDLPAAAVVFFPHAQAPSGAMTFVARTATDPALALSGLQSEFRAVFPDRPVFRTAALPNLVAGSLSGRRFMLTLILAFGVLAVALAATGVYGVISLMSTQRSKEFGLRLALGANRSEILRIVMRQGAAIMTLGVALGLGGALIMGQVLRRFLFGVGPNDPWTLAAVCATLSAIGAVACLVPALRATRVSPVVTLRNE